MVSSKECRILVLQGGGALGSYQGGVYEALDAAGIRPDWVAGISIGAVNAAIIAGNSADRRVARLREFWELASSALLGAPAGPGEQMRGWFNETSAAWAMAAGIPGFFAPRFPPPFLQPAGAPEALSFYDTAALRETLLRLVDFELINHGPTRLSVGAVNVRTGNFTYFDSRHQRLGPEHVLASGALPPGLPPVEIDGEFYWDGGLVSNTPLQYVFDEDPEEDLLIFQVDLFSARGAVPRTILEVAGREKDIRYSSRTRVATDANLKLHKAKTAVRKLIDKLPPDLRDDPDAVYLSAISKQNAVRIMQLIYQPNVYESQSKDYEFSRHTMLQRWKAGMDQVARTLRHRRWLQLFDDAAPIRSFDLARDALD